MHLHHPSLTLTGKKKGKKKFRNAEDAKKARELEESWKALQKRWGLEDDAKKRDRAMKAAPLKYSLSVPADRSTAHIRSLDTGAAVAAKAEVKVYTGDKVVGVTVLHKSCLQPVFNEQAAKDAASMRR